MHIERVAMIAYIILIIFLVLVITIILLGIYIVPQQSAFIIERLGKFKKVSQAGLHLKIPLIDRIAGKANLRVSQLAVQLETKTEDNVFVTISASTQYRVNPNDVAPSFYELSNPVQQMRSYMEDALRSTIPSMSLDTTFAEKDNIAYQVQLAVAEEMSQFGFTVIKTLVTAIDPSNEVKRSMDSINAAQREKEATRERAAAEKIAIEMQASAESERTRLQGEGQANYRREIASGIVDQIKSLQQVGMDIDAVNQVVLFNQYLDVMRSLANSTNGKTIILPAATPGGYSNMRDEIMQAMMAGNEIVPDKDFTDV